MPDRIEQVCYRTRYGKLVPAFCIRRYTADFELRDESGKVDNTLSREVIDLVAACSPAEAGCSLDSLPPEQVAAGYVVFKGVFEGDANHRWAYGEHDIIAKRHDELRRRAEAADEISTRGRKALLEAAETRAAADSETTVLKAELETARGATVALQASAEAGEKQLAEIRQQWGSLGVNLRAATERLREALPEASGQDAQLLRAFDEVLAKNGA